MKTLFLILLTLCSKPLFSQNWPFISGLPNADYARGIVKTRDEGVIIAIQTWNHHLAKLDINGNLLWSKTFINPNSLFPIGNICNTSSEGIAITGEYFFPGNTTDAAHVIILNSCGEVEWCKTINVSGFNYGKFVSSLQNGNILLSTYNASANPGIDRYQLWEIDPDGHILWMKQVLPGTQTYFRNTEFLQMCLTSDGGSLLAGYTYYPYDTTNNPYDAVLQPCFVKCDSLGSTQWVYPPLGGADTTRFGFFTSCTQIGNSYYAVGSHYDTTEFFLRPLVARFDLNGNMLSYNYTPADTMYHVLTQVVPATDTSLLLISAANTVFTDPNYLMVFIADTMGNLQKSFTRTDLVVGQYGDEVAKMRDNKFVIPCQSPIGWPGANTDVVAIKLNANLEYDSIYTQPFTYDSLCPYPIVSDTILCDCEPFVSVKQPQQARQAMLLKPNPATEWFTAEVPYTLPKTCTLRVYDMQGRLQYETLLPPGTKQISLNCTTWKRGIYLVHCLGSGIELSGKLIVE